MGRSVLFKSQAFFCQKRLPVYRRSSSARQMPGPHSARLAQVWPWVVDGLLWSALLTEGERVLLDALNRMRRARQQEALNGLEAAQSRQRSRRWSTRCQFALNEVMALQGQVAQLRHHITALERRVWHLRYQLRQFVVSDSSPGESTPGWES